MNPSISHGGNAAIETETKPNPVLVGSRYEGCFFENGNEYEYGETDGGMWIRKTVWEDGSPFALFELDIEALPDFLVNLVSKFHREKYGCEPPVGDAQYWADTVTEWVKYTDETVCLDSPLVWIRCSLENGEPYSLFVPADATVCKSCDVVLGNWTAKEIRKAETEVVSLADRKRWFEAGDCFEPDNERFWNDVYNLLSNGKHE